MLDFNVSFGDYRAVLKFKSIVNEGKELLYRYQIVNEKTEDNCGYIEVDNFIGSLCTHYLKMLLELKLLQILKSIFKSEFYQSASYKSLELPIEQLELVVDKYCTKMMDEQVLNMPFSFTKIVKIGD